MDRKKLKSRLQDAVEQEIPSSQIDLLPNVKDRLVPGTTRQGEKMTFTSSRRRRRVALAALAVGAFLAVAFVTPQGRAVAQTVLQLFRRADSYERPLETEQIPPTPGEWEPTVPPPAPLVSVSEAERTAGFDAKELPMVPMGFTFDGAMAGPGGISIQYQAQGHGGQLIINQSTDGFMESEWDQAPAEFISPAKVGELYAEVVQGAYVVYPGEMTARWNPDVPILRLRWIEGGTWFEMAKFGGVESIAYLDRNGLIALAESMTYAPGDYQSLQTEPLVAEAQVTVAEFDHVSQVNLEDAKRVANFAVREPASTPQGMIFAGATATQGSITLQYESQEKGAGTLSINESLSGENWQVLPTEAITSVPIGNVNAELAKGAYIYPPGTTSGTWNAEVNIMQLRWVEDGIWFEILLTGGGVGSLAHLDQNGLVALAESLVHKP